MVACLVVGAIGRATGLNLVSLFDGRSWAARPTTLWTTSVPTATGLMDSAMDSPAAASPGSDTAAHELPSLRQWRYANYYDAPEARTALELAVLAFMRAVKEKPDWVTKVADDSIVARWVAEASATSEPSSGHAAPAEFSAAQGAPASTAHPPPGVREDASVRTADTAAPYRTLTPAVLSAAIAELRADAARARAAPADAAPAGIEAVWTADTLIPASEAAAMAEAAEGLAAHSPPDWHPGSDGIVRDLLHPSLYAYVTGVSRVLSEPAMRSDMQWRDFLRSGLPEGALPSGDGVSPDYAAWAEGPTWVDGQSPEGWTVDPTGTILVAPRKRATHQWLPSTFHVSQTADGYRADILSHYIVGLHPVRQAPVYRALEAVLARMVPLLERVLSDVDQGELVRYPVDFAAMATLIGPTAEDPDPEIDWEAHSHNAEDSSLNAAEAISRTNRARRMRERLPALFDDQARELAAQMADKAAEPEPLTVCFGGRQLQAVVKVARIELPAGQSYAGGTWHMEGTREEAIVATGIYYYEADNIAGSRLAFRTAYMHPAYEQNDAHGAKLVWGLVDGETHTTLLGSIATDTPGRVIVFPNTYQHRVEPFGLADPTRPGRRSIVAFFFIDPATPGGDGGISADTVPPQDVRWLREEEAAEAAEARGAEGEGVERRGDGIVDTVAAAIAAAVGVVDAPAPRGWMTRHTAERHREELMAERVIREDRESVAYEEAFSLCEH